MFKRILIVAVVAALSLAGYAYAEGGPHWTAPVTAWSYADDGADTNLVLMRQLGTADDTVDDTAPVTFSPLGVTWTITEHSSPWRTLDLKPFGVPADATAVELGVKTVITKPTSPANAVVNVFMRASGSSCCEGPDGFTDYPVDYSTSNNPDHLGLVAQAVTETAPGGERQYDDIVEPVVNGELEWAWSYRDGAGDAVGFDVYVNGWAS